MNLCAALRLCIVVLCMNSLAMDYRYAFIPSATAILSSFYYGIEYCNVMKQYRQDNVKAFAVYVESPWRRMIFKDLLTTLFIDAVITSKREMVNLFCQYGYAQRLYEDRHVYESPLHKVVNQSIAKALICVGANVLTRSEYKKEYLHDQPSYIETPLFNAAREKNLDVIKVLLTACYLDFPLSHKKRESTLTRCAVSRCLRYFSVAELDNKVPEEVLLLLIKEACRTKTAQEKHTFVQEWKHKKCTKLLQLFCEIEYELHKKKVCEYVTYKNIVGLTAYEQSKLIPKQSDQVDALLNPATVQEQLGECKSEIIAMIQQKFAIEM